MNDLVRITAPGGTVIATIWPSQPISPLNQIWARVLEESEAIPLSGHRLPADDDFNRSARGFAELLREAGLRTVETQEIDWDFEIHRDDLWYGLEAGIGNIGMTYQKQDDRGQKAMRDAFLRLVASTHLILPSTAIIGSGIAP